MKTIELRFIVNHQAISNSLSIRIKPEYIDSISVLRGDAAIQQFEIQGKEKVVILFDSEQILDGFRTGYINGQVQLVLYRLESAARSLMHKLCH